MGRAVTRFVWGAVVLLAATGVAYAQGTETVGIRGAAGAVAQPVAEPEEGGGILAGIRAGVSEIFTGERLRVHLNGAYQASARRSELETSFPTYGEQSRFLTQEDFHGGGHIDIGSSLRVWRRFGFGVSYTQMRNSGSAVVTGSVPHPLEAGRERSVPTRTFSLPHRQRATHAYVTWRIPLYRALEMELSAGATYFSLRQGVVVELSPVEVGGPPFSDVGLVAGTAEHTRDGGGFNAGVDVWYMLTPATRIPQLGIGCFARVTSGTVSLPVDANSWRRVSVGGVQTGAGLRLLF